MASYLNTTGRRAPDTGVVDRRRTWILLFVVLSVVFAPVACVTRQKSLREVLAGIPEKHIAYYDFDASVSMAERISLPPESLLDLYRESEGNDDIVGVDLSEPLRRQVVDAIEALPALHQRVLSERLVAIYCVEGISGRGIADYILGSDDSVYAYLILNTEVFDMTAAELVRSRDLSSFADDGSGVDLLVALSDGAGNEISGLFYILLHETTHIVDYVERYTPYVEPSMFELFGASGRDTGFTDSVWDSYAIPKPEFAVPHQQEFNFYGFGEVTLTRSDLTDVFEGLRQSVFPSLYASSLWAEDFAEYVTFFNLIFVPGGTFRLSVVMEGEELVDWEPMSNPAIVARARSLDGGLFRHDD